MWDLKKLSSRIEFKFNIVNQKNERNFSLIFFMFMSFFNHSTTYGYIKFMKSCVFKEID